MILRLLSAERAAVAQRNSTGAVAMYTLLCRRCYKGKRLVTSSSAVPTVKPCPGVPGIHLNADRTVSMTAALLCGAGASPVHKYRGCSADHDQIEDHAHAQRHAWEMPGRCCYGINHLVQGNRLILSVIHTAYFHDVHPPRLLNSTCTEHMASRRASALVSAATPCKSSVHVTCSLQSMESATVVLKDARTLQQNRPHKACWSFSGGMKKLLGNL